jgi:hypothetical protein
MNMKPAKKPRKTRKLKRKNKTPNRPAKKKLFLMSIWVYTNTNRGSAVVRFFGELDKSLPVKEEEGKCLPVSY